MFCLSKGICRWALLGGLAVGGATLFLGRDGVAAVFDQTKTSVRAAVDEFVDDPIALRRELESLARKYPEKIGHVRTELAEVERQIARLSHDAKVAERVVANATEDLSDLKQLMARAQEEEATSGRTVVVRFEARRLDASEAIDEFTRISRIRESYRDRLARSVHDLEYLTQQRDRLHEILSKLQTEYTDFEHKMWQVDRRIEAIARNERLAEMVEERQAVLAEFDRDFRSNTFEQLQSKLSKWDAEVQARLEAAEQKSFTHDYEDEARWELESQAEAELLEEVELEIPEEAEEADADNFAEIDLEDENLALGSPIVD